MVGYGTAGYGGGFPAWECERPAEPLGGEGVVFSTTIMSVGCKVTLLQGSSTYK